MSQIFPQNKMAIHAKLQWPLERTTFKFSLLNQWRHSGNLCTHEECRTFEKIPQSVCQMLVTILRLLLRSFRHPRFIVFSPFHLSAGLLGGLGWKKVEDKLASVGWRREKWWWPSLLLLCIYYCFEQCSAHGSGPSRGQSVVAMSATFMYCCSLLMVAVAQTEGKVGLAKAAWQAFHWWSLTTIMGTDTPWTQGT